MSPIARLKFARLNLLLYTYTYNHVYCITKSLAVPVIQLQPSTATEAGEQTILHCNATGIDTPTVSWRSGGIDVGSSNDSRLTSYSNGSLVITDTKVLDTGNYSCIAENKAGSTNFTTTLNVTGT